jgi:hypothetical protein
MFCYQCQETSKGKGCDMRGICGKTEEVAKLQDLLIYTLKGISEIVIKSGADTSKLTEINHQMLNSLFMTITNANFDDTAIEKQIKKMLSLRNELRSIEYELHNAALFEVGTREEMYEKASKIGVLSTENEDVRSLREMITYGIKGMAAYAEHALNLGKESNEIYSFIYEALAATLNDNLTADDLVALTLKTGEYGVKVMALLDWDKNVDPNYKKHYFRQPVVICDNEQYTEKWIAYGNPYIAAKELTVKPGQTVTIYDETAYGCILVQGWGKLEDTDCAAATMLRFGQLSQDEFFISGDRAAKGLTVTNRSSCEPIVMLKHFPHNPAVPEAEE